MPNVKSEIPYTNDPPLTEDDDAYDETESENEAPIRETDDAEELPEEMEYDDEEGSSDSEDDRSAKKALDPRPSEIGRVL